MRLVAGLIFVLSCVSCGSGGDGGNNNHGYGFAFDAQSASGLMLRYDASIPEAERSPIEAFEAVYAGVQACMGVTAPGPLLIVVPSGALDAGNDLQPGQGILGEYHIDTRTAIVTHPPYALRHEFVHHLLKESGLSDVRNDAHDSPFFNFSCGAILPFP